MKNSDLKKEIKRKYFCENGELIRKEQSKYYVREQI